MLRKPEVGDMVSILVDYPQHADLRRGDIAPVVGVAQGRAAYSIEVTDRGWWLTETRRGTDWELCETLQEEDTEIEEAQSAAAYNEEAALGVRNEGNADAFTGLPSRAQARKEVPVFTGFVNYFPNAMAAVARLSKKGNDQHNPGQPLHWSKGKSADHSDCLMRHLLERDTMDSDGINHSVKVAWRAMADLQTLIEEGHKMFEDEAESEGN